MTAHTIDTFHQDPRQHLAVALADYSARRLAPIILRHSADRIESSGRPVIEGGAPGLWDSIPGIIRSFRVTADAMESAYPLTTRTAVRKAFRTLDNVRTGAAWVDWNEGGRIQDQIVHAEMPADTALSIAETLDVDPVTWDAQYSGPQDDEVDRLLGAAIKYVRLACADAAAGGPVPADVEDLIG